MSHLTSYLKVLEHYGNDHVTFLYNYWQWRNIYALFNSLARHGINFPQYSLIQTCCIKIFCSHTKTSFSLSHRTFIHSFILYYTTVSPRSRKNNSSISVQRSSGFTV